MITVVDFDLIDINYLIMQIFFLIIELYLLDISNKNCIFVAIIYDDYLF